MDGPLYDFLPEEDILPFPPETLAEYERFLNSDTDRPPVALDPDYVAYLRIAYGRALRNCWFRDDRGRKRQIDRIFSHARRADLTGVVQGSWRRGGGDIRLDYSIEYFESLLPNWNDHPDLVPFA